MIFTPSFSFFHFMIVYQQHHKCRMEPLIKLNNKNNLFDCPIHKTTAELLNGKNNNQQLYYLSSYRSQQQQNQSAKKQQARDKNGIGELSDAEHTQHTHQQLKRSQLLILW